MVTERQKELAEWFEALEFEDETTSSGMMKFSHVYIGDSLDSFGKIGDGNNMAGGVIGPWLDADWCGEFLEIMEDHHRNVFRFKWHTGNNLETRFDHMTSYFHNDGELTCRLQSCVKRIIEELPEESKAVIKGMND